MLQITEDCNFCESDFSDIDYAEESDYLTESEESCDENNGDCEYVVITYVSFIYFQERVRLKGGLTFI